MACNSVATTSTKITKVVLAQEDLKSLLAGLIKQAGLNASEIDTWQAFNGSLTAYTYASGFDIEIRQYNQDGAVKVDLIIGGSSQAQNDALTAKLTPSFDKLLVQAQQTNVLKRLAQLGKLSQVKGKDSGVVAKLEITI